MADYKTVFGGLNDFTPGGVDAIDDNPKNYVFSNVFDVASRSAPYERVAVGKNLEYVMEAIRAEGQSPWYACAHDEFALCMDGEVEIHLVRTTQTVRSIRTARVRPCWTRRPTAGRWDALCCAAAIRPCSRAAPPIASRPAPPASS